MCQHHYYLGSSHDGVVRGKCKLCGHERKFCNTIEDCVKKGKKARFDNPVNILDMLGKKSIPMI